MNDNILRGYRYEYDDINRLKEADFFEGLLIFSTTPKGHFKEHLTYDKNGNILSLNRTGELVSEQPVEIDELTYQYTGNQLQTVTDATNNTDGFNDGNTTGADFIYDSFGNMVADNNKNIVEIVYNHLNLPVELTFGNGGIINYIYDAAGTQLSKKVQPNGGALVTTDYINGFDYKDGVLQTFPQPEGYVENKLISNGGRPFFKFVYHYIYKDHLGNNRLVYADLDDNGIINPATEIVEENNYYPFGLKHKGYNQLSGDGYKYKFQGQELQDELGLDWYSFKWRNYMPDLGRFFGIDPLTTDYHWMTPYQFSSNQVTHAPEIEGMESGADFAVNLKVAEQLSKRDNSDLIDNYRMVKKANELPIPDQVSVMVLRYASPVEDVFGLITGRDLEGNSYHRGEAAGWTALSFFPFAKVAKGLKVMKGFKYSDEVSALVSKTGTFGDEGKEIFTLTKSGSFRDAKKVTNDILGDLGSGAVDYVSTTGKGKNPFYGKVVGKKATNGAGKGWRVDWDSKTGAHINWWTKNEKGSITFTGDFEQAKRIIDNLFGN